ncbi:MAG: succinate dehydrogenase, cytochrome b556 subunit [Anaerolineae bacterium]|nr:succinate dehydrogenase, cytochrome b556 subunit [Anaerolineae bacterium]
MNRIFQKPGNAIQWFDPRGRQLGYLAFILNRITGMGLALYLLLHLIMLGKLAQGPQAYNSFIETVHHPVFIFGELLVIFAALIHGLNGLRIILTSFGIGVEKHKPLFTVLMIAALVSGVYFAARMIAR